MPSPRHQSANRRSPIAWLFIKEWRELLASRAWWLMLLAMGPLVGMSFISAVTAYGELSGVNGTAAGVGEAFSPLIGIWAPTFSACELAAAFLLPFVAIRLVSGDRQSGAMKIESQHSLSSLTRIAIKCAVLMSGWILATLAPTIGVILWRSYGGHIYAPELLTVIAGHLLNGGLTIALAVTAAAITEHPATAAIVTLSVTVGTWLINFAAAVNGGWWERAAAFTPTAMVAEFQRGLLRADITLAAIGLIGFGMALASIWLRTGVSISRRASLSLVTAAIVGIVVAGSSTVSASWDSSESRRNSFSEAEEAALRSITGDLRVEAHFAPEDPRRSDLERGGLRKLRRALPRVRIDYVSATSVGLFEQTADKYGEIWYELDGRKAMSRITTAEGVIEAVLTLAGIAPPPESDEDIFRGHPLAVTPRGAAWLFYGVWPLTVAGMAFAIQRRQGMRRLVTGIVATVMLAAAVSAADIKVDLSKETVGRPPATFTPMVGTWVIAQDGADKVVMVDGRPWVASKDNPTKLLIESARKLYGTSNEELMDNAKQFAYFPVAVLKSVPSFSSGAISVKFKTVAGDADRASGILFNVKPNGDWLSIRYNDTEHNVALWEFHNGIRRRVAGGPEGKWMLDRAAWHELKMTVDGADFKAYMDGEMALEYTLGSEPRPGRNGAAPNPDMYPANNAVLRPPVNGQIGLWAKTDSTSYFKDYIVSPK